MAKIVCIHGIANTYRSAAQLTSEWSAALQGGLDEANGPTLAPDDLKVVAYGALFRPDGNGKGQAIGSAHQGVSETAPWEDEFVKELWHAAATLSEESRGAGNANRGAEDPSIQSPDFPGKMRAPQFLQRGLKQLTKSRFLKQIGPSLLISELGQVRSFLHDPAYRGAILERLAAKVTPETRVIVAHSLGSVVAYEALCAYPEWKIDTLVTLGSPLGIRNVVFDMLARVAHGEQDLWPGVRQWFNIADKGDLVALVKELAPLFGPVKDAAVYNGYYSHDVTNYLTARVTGEAVASGL